MIVKDKKLYITLNDWSYHCVDGCCTNYGTEISLNGKKCDNEYAGDGVMESLKFVLTELGYEVEFN